ncbi:fluconazole resistance protein [Dactylonectria macrodidyma]|uniref:Fluconazole resistance protein n=1 Tax=Dactylonectria macrodidyma TaxID=307937 RepID=A0A9P9EA91_9HYPO|nr:fluconazole resistance protein [Dactylonectria macrodidyma]
MFAPGMLQALQDLHSDNVDMGNLSVSILVLGYAFGPLIHAPLSELYGRLVLYHVNSVLFVIFNVGCALSVNLPMLIIFRLLTGIVGACPLALGPASISDMFKQEERGRAIATWNLPILLGPTLGPLVGSYLASAKGWRWDFWFLSIAAKSHPATLLGRKAAKLRKQTGNRNISTALASNESHKATIINALVRPTRLLFLSPVIFTLSLCAAVNYGYIYILFTTMSSTFEEKYAINSSNVGLVYLGYGLGNIIGNIALGIFSDPLLKKMAGEGEMKPEYRLPPLLPGSMLVPAGLFIYGWTLEYSVHWIVPLLGQFIVGFGAILVFVPINTYVVDAFTNHAASAIAATTVFRSLGGGLLPLCGDKLYQAVGDGWGNSVLAFVGIAFLPAVWLIYKYGERMRTSSKDKY